MEITLLAAKVLGLYLVVSGLFLIFRGKTVPSLMKDLFDHPAMLYLSGIILIFLSTIYLLQNNIWDGSYRVVMTVIMWAVFIKGIAYIIFPSALHKLANKTVLGFVNIFGIVAVVAGIVLYYVG